MPFRMLLPVVLLSLFLRQSLLLGGVEDDHSPVWSPDGSRIAFLRNGTATFPSELFTLSSLTSGPGEIAKLPTAASATFPVWSPKSGQIAYLENGAQTHSIHLMNSDGSQDHRIVERTSTITSLVWSPDGSNIASWSGGELFVLNSDGSDFAIVDRHDVTPIWPTWSPNGDQIDYVKTLNSSEGNAIAVINKDGGDAKIILERPSIVSVLWSPLGNQLAFVYREADHHELAIVNIDGSGFTRLTTGQPVESNISWSPDGNWIAYQSANQISVVSPVDQKVIPFGPFDGTFRLAVWSPDSQYVASFYSGYGSNTIYLHQFDGSGYSRAGNFFLPDGAVVDYLSWAPDSSQIVFQSHQAKQFSALYSMGSRGEKVTSLSDNLPVELFTWSPNGQQLAFGSGDLYVVNADGTNRHIVTGGKTIEQFAWSYDSQYIAIISGDLYIKNIVHSTELRVTTFATIHDFAWSPVTNRIALSNGDLYLVDADGSNWSKVTSDGTDHQPAWSPDGSKVAFAAYGINTINADGTNLRKVTDVPGITLSWLPDGRYLAFMGLAVWVVDTNGGQLTKLSEDGVDSDFGGSIPIWSPDGRHLVLSIYGYITPGKTAKTHMPNPSCISVTDYVVSLDGSGLTSIGFGCNRVRQSTPLISWSGDSQFIVSSAGSLSSFNADGTGQKFLMPPTNTISWAPDGHAFVYAGNGSGGSDLYVVTEYR